MAYGRYQYQRLPMGRNTAPKMIQSVFTDISVDVPDLQIIMDDNNSSRNYRRTQTVN